MHVVTVYDVRPLESEGHCFEPYFVALCTCDTYPQVRDRESEAREDAQQHATQTGGHLEPEVHRPVGQVPFSCLERLWQTTDDSAGRAARILDGDAS